MTIFYEFSRGSGEVVGLGSLSAFEALARALS